MLFAVNEGRQIFRYDQHSRGVCAFKEENRCKEQKHGIAIFRSCGGDRSHVMEGD